MSGFYSKMLINIRNLYFNNSDDMKTILHGIFLDAADVFLNGYTPSYCEENELIPTAQKFVEKFGSTKACETGVTKEAVASAMCNPAALVALMHDSDYDVLKEAFYYAWAKHKFEHNLAQCIRNFGDYIAMPSPSTTDVPSNDK